MIKLEWIGKDKVINYCPNTIHSIKRKYSYDERGLSYDDNGSENMIIHGNNLDALISLLPKYEGKVKCIYIDPPYNTAKSSDKNKIWIYSDCVDDPKIQKWLNKTVCNEQKDFTKHDKWLCMIYPCLKLLYKLLSQDGIIFISIDDNEQASLKIICDEIFGEKIL
jgi:adenine-specific DNA-methyltransferase